MPTAYADDEHENNKAYLEAMAMDEQEIEEIRAIHRQTVDPIGSLERCLAKLADHPVDGGPPHSV